MAGPPLPPAPSLPAPAATPAAVAPAPAASGTGIQGLLGRAGAGMSGALRDPKKVACLTPIVMTVLMCLPICLCCGAVIYMITGAGATSKSEFTWPAGVTPNTRGEAQGGVQSFPQVQGNTEEIDPGYLTYRSAGWIITSPYGWRTYMDEDLNPIPGEYEFHAGIDVAGPGLQFRDPIYPPLDTQPYFIGFADSEHPYIGGAGEAVRLWNVHTTEETPVFILYGHLEPYRIALETYCRRDEQYEPNIAFTIACRGPVVSENGTTPSNTGSTGQVQLVQGTPGDCSARVQWPENQYEVDGLTTVTFDQHIDEVNGVAYDAVVRFYGCKKEPTPTPTPTETPTMGALAASEATTPALGYGGPNPDAGKTPNAAQATTTPRATATRLPSPTPQETGAPTVPATPIPPVTIPTQPTIPPPTAGPTPPGPTGTATRLPSPTWTPTTRPSSTPTRLPSPTPPGWIPPVTPSRTPWPTAPLTPWPTWPPYPTGTPGPTSLPGPTSTSQPQPTSGTPLPSMTPGPRPTTVPHNCPIGENLCYFPGFGPPLKLGSKLKQGQTILGYVGTSGRSTGPHVHLAVSIWGRTQIDVLEYYRPTNENGDPVPEDKLHYGERYPLWQDPLQFMPQANGELGPSYMDMPLQLPPGQIIPEAGAGTWYSPGDVYSGGGGGRFQGWINYILCGWFNYLCP